MHVFTFIQPFVAVLVLAYTALCAPIPFAIQRRWKEGPLLINNFPDPSIIQVDGSWYAFSTSSGGKNVQMATSADFGGWGMLDRDALPNLGAWADDTGPLAPDVVRMPNGTFVLYYAAMNKAHSGRCIGAATSTVVTGPYAATDAYVVCPVEEGGAINAAGFRDTDGSQWLLYKIDSNSLGTNPDHTPIMITRLTLDGLSAVDQPMQLLDRGQYDGPSIEAPSLVRTDDGTYVLFFSSNNFYGPWYDTSYATATSITGPYTKAVNPLLMSGDSMGLDQPPLYSPGGLDIDVDGTHVVFHADMNHDASVRNLFAGKVKISGGIVTI